MVAGLHLQSGAFAFTSAYILEHLIYVKNNINKYERHEDLHNYNTRGRVDLVPAHCRLKRCQCRPSHLGVKLFNRLPVRTRELPQKIFKHNVKSYLIKEAILRS